MANFTDVDIAESPESIAQNEEDIEDVTNRNLSSPLADDIPNRMDVSFIIRLRCRNRLKFVYVARS